MQTQPNTIDLQPELLVAIEKMSEKTHISKEKLVHNALIEMLEDYHDAKAAEEAMAQIESGEEKLLSWEKVKAGLHDLDN